ncbi:ABC transporter permease subunit [Vibrio parahaemolyticus]|uniref:ABC transporter permease subunit n=1 Tax=Vibrio natriegens TaxID=691 RepID=UPI00159423E9|nr:ABC transporter permease subunit [Vibrio natriegens]NVC92152.1 ABC transporter permease subunit [Vibrio natriegens]UYI47255.1 ABC transporter permease subunit [Vibrio natriegens]WMN87451.1 ABC transporter permease subunit [Vibrio parahaemolyticus]
MLSYFLRRLALVIPTFLGITILIFAITRFVPGGPVERMLSQMQSQGDGAASMTSAGGNTALSDDQIAELNAFYGLDKPVMEAYVEWLSRLVTLDLGESTRYYEPVSEMIAERLPVSLFYGGMTFFISYFISIPLGYYKALKHGSVFDSSSSILIFVGYALPGYVVGVLLITLFSYHLEWFPMGGFVGDDFDDYETFFERAKDIMWHAVLPLICYLIGDFATLTMTMKNNLMENLSSDYIRTAIAKGLPFKKAVRRHALRNSLIPIASHFGNSLLFFMTGAFLIEVIFNIDGIGLLGYESIMERDYPVVMGIVAINAILLLIGNIVSDICVALVDPRVKFGA